jgi:hypothetical protein
MLSDTPHHFGVGDRWFRSGIAHLADGLLDRGSLLARQLIGPEHGSIVERPVNGVDVKRKSHGLRLGGHGFEPSTPAGQA